MTTIRGCFLHRGVEIPGTYGSMPIDRKTDESQICVLQNMLLFL